MSLPFQSRYRPSKNEDGLKIGLFAFWYLATGFKEPVTAPQFSVTFFHLTWFKNGKFPKLFLILKLGFIKQCNRHDSI